MDEMLLRDDLLKQIRNKQKELEKFINQAKPRKFQLLNISMVAGIFSAFLTATPALGGQKFATWLTTTFSLTSPAWQLLCGLASACSLTAILANHFLKSQNLEEYVARAQDCRAKLNVLDASLALKQINTEQASQEYLKCVETASFLN